MLPCSVAFFVCFRIGCIIGLLQSRFYGCFLKLLFYESRKLCRFLIVLLQSWSCIALIAHCEAISSGIVYR